MQGKEKSDAVYILLRVGFEKDMCLFYSSLKHHILHPNVFAPHVVGEFDLTR
jgi:hypothetical protein